MKRAVSLIMILVLLAGCAACARPSGGGNSIIDVQGSQSAYLTQPAATQAGDSEPTAQATVPVPANTEPAGTDSAEPTAVYTALPTEEQTEAATELPTEQPTAAPTAAPTASATASATAAATATARPTATASATAAATATARPTAAPTQQHTAAPTQQVTAAPTSAPTPTPSATASPNPGTSETVYWNPYWQYADRSVIHTGTATLYHTSSSNPKHFIVAVNAGHGTAGGSSVYTLCHPDGSPKVTGGSTSEGSIYAVAVSGGTVMLDGTSEAAANLGVAKKLKNLLLNYGFDVLMIRESSDVQLDNVARTVMANNVANCHIAIHYDSTESNKGLYVCNVAQVSSYLNMEPVRSHHLQHEALASCVISGARSCGVKIYGSGSFEFDLTQTSYSTIPSANIEVGDRASDISSSGQYAIAEALLYGVINYYYGYVSSIEAAEHAEPVQVTAWELDIIPCVMTGAVLTEEKK